MLLAPAFAATEPGLRTDKPVEAVREVLQRPQGDLDYLEAKLAFDRVIKPEDNETSIRAELERLEEAARAFAGPAPSNSAKLSALRKVIYESGPWNAWRNFEYDHSNVRGENVRIKLLSNYLETRRGDCVSMPVMFLILAERLGLDVALALAPNHFIVRHRAEDGAVTNLETTSGALPQRETWLRQVRPMTDRSIESGMYLRSLSKREGIAEIAVPVVQFLRDERRYEEAAAVCDLILAVNPRDALVLINLALVCEKLGLGILERYGSELLIPLTERLQYWNLVAHNNAAIARARVLVGE